MKSNKQEFTSMLKDISKDKQIIKDMMEQLDNYIKKSKTITDNNEKIASEEYKQIVNNLKQVYVDYDAKISTLASKLKITKQ